MSSHDLRRAVVVDVTCEEQRFLVAGSVGCQALQLGHESLGDVVEVEFHVDVERLLLLFGQYVVVDVLLEAAAELGYVFLL